MSPRLLVQLTEDELDQLVARALERVLAAQKPAAEFVDRRELAARLGISLTKLDRLCRDGLPFTRVGDVKRFRVENVDAWLAQRTESPA